METVYVVRDGETWLRIFRKEAKEAAFEYASTRGGLTVHLCQLVPVSFNS